MTIQTLDKIKPVLNFIKKNNRPALQMIEVRENGLYATDLETYIHIKYNFGVEIGHQNINTLGLVDSVKDFEDFPCIDFTTSSTESLTVKVETLKHLLKFASKDETRLSMNSIALNDGALVAVDGHTLHFVELEKKFNREYLMPRTSIGHLIKICSKYKLKEIELLFGDEFTTVRTEYFTLKMRNICRDFVKWRHVVPTKFENSVGVTNWVNFKELKPLFCPYYKCELKEVEGNLVLIPKNYPNNQYIIGKCDIEGLRLLFNASYIERAASGSKEFTIKYNSELTPTEINSSIVMPQRDV